MIRAILLFGWLFFSVQSFAQGNEPIRSGDTLSAAKPASLDTSKIRKYNPKTAAIRSAILPGLGQIYNKKYWKLPIVYAALGITTGIFVYNLKNYSDTKFAYRVKFNMRENGSDSSLFASIKENLKPLSEESLRQVQIIHRALAIRII